MAADETEIRPGPVPAKGGELEAIHVEKVRGATEQNERLKTIGRRLTPDGMKYIGSIGIHIFKSTTGGAQVAVATQNACNEKATRFEANFALQQASIEVAKSYGWKPPAVRTDVMKRDIHGRSGLILPEHLHSNAPSERNDHGQEEN